ncbi:MAG TPA: hypothetical protein ENF32_04915 [Thermosulfidibacter takaii]|uniref:Uncharacterized protein n=1 Tax=Thermosulfidibacter takaii TaxID=412593 RepID=A0A7C0U731_9BACT|nr:hypothetical protein [Thermosulfidibacter takaii]
MDTLVQWASLLALAHYRGYVSFSFNTRRGDMANRRLSMRKIKEVLRLKYEAGLSNRAIARSCNICHRTVTVTGAGRSANVLEGLFSY